MAFCDFVVYHNFEEEPLQDLTNKIIYSIFIKRLKHKKPCVIYVGGDSGEGKSFTALVLQLLCMQLQGINAYKYLDAMNVYTPLEYPEKLNRLLFDKKLKPLNIIAVHEAREVVKAKLWFSFLNQSISDINAMSRSVKRLMTIIISQFIRDISPDVRYTLNYYCMMRRPKGKKARLYINILWKDDRDLEKPRLRKRKLSGYIVDPKTRQYKRFVPKYLEVDKPPQEVINMFEERDKAAKASIIHKKITKLIKEMKQDIGEENTKIDTMVAHYSKNRDNLPLIGRVYRGKWKVTKTGREMHELSEFEAANFEEKLNTALKVKK